jgi:hypothetical protein
VAFVPLFLTMEIIPTSGSLASAVIARQAGVF